HRFPLGMAGSGRQQQPDRRAGLGYAPTKDVAGSGPLLPTDLDLPRRFTRQPGGGARRVVIFGAGGPLAAISAQALERDHVLRLCDKRSLADMVAEAKPQSRGAPLPRLLDAPHEMYQVDVTDYSEVLAATRGMDAVIN